MSRPTHQPHALDCEPALLLQVPPGVQAHAMARAAKELGPDAANEALRIRAAEIASKGVPA